MQVEKSIVSVFAAMAALVASAQAQHYTILSSAAALTNLTQDGKCNLTEAMTSMLSGPPNTDCVSTSGPSRTVTLSGANTAYQIATGITVWSDMTLRTLDAGVVVEAAGQPLATADGCTFTVTGPSSGMTVRVKSGSNARALRNQGGMVATNIVFQGANISGLSGENALGGVIFNWGQLTMTGGAIQNGTAQHGGGLYNKTPSVTLTNVKIQNNTATGSGGGLYLEDPTAPIDKIVCNRCQILNNIATARGGGAYNNGWLKLDYSVVKGNKAGQGGGIYHRQPVNGKQPELTLLGTTLSENKAISTELTPVPGPAGTSITSAIMDGSGNTTSATPCSGSETPNEAFDGSYATKWCNSGTVPSTGAKVVLSYMFPSGTFQTVSAYSITWANDATGRDPKSWTLEGYTGTNWVPLHNVNDFGFSGGPRHTTESFNGEAFTPFFFSNSIPHRGYRLVITKNQGNVNVTQLAEFQIFPQWRTGDGGGIFTIGHMNIFHSTLSGNIAGCTSGDCGCASAFCATTTNTSQYMGKGGALYAGNPPPESLNFHTTVAGNSAGQGGGVYHDHYDHWDWNWSLIGKNAARTNRSPEPDFHGNPHTLGSYQPIFVQNTAGTNGMSPGPNGDVTGQDPLLNALADNGGKFTDLKPHTHALQAFSPALDRAFNSGDTEDQRGVLRPQGSNRDLGSFEKQP